MGSIWKRGGIATGVVRMVIQIIGISVEPGRHIVIIVTSLGIMPEFAC